MILEYLKNIIFWSCHIFWKFQLQLIGQSTLLFPSRKKTYLFLNYLVLCLCIIIFLIVYYLQDFMTHSGKSCCLFSSQLHVLLGKTNHMFCDKDHMLCSWFLLMASNQQLVLKTIHLLSSYKHHLYMQTKITMKAKTSQFGLTLMIFVIN